MIQANDGVATLDQALDPDPGVRAGLSFEGYANIPAINWHTLEPHRLSAKHAREAMLHPRDASEAQVGGEAFHCAVLEPERFAKQYITRPKFDGHPNSNAYKAAKQEWEFNNASMVHLSLDEYAELKAMQRAVKEHPIASAILAGKGRNEMSLVWIDPDTKATMKGRIDRLCRARIGLLDPLASNPDADAVCLVDFKTTRSVDPRGFNRARADYGYHSQLSLYLDGLSVLQPGVSVVPLIVAVENKSPFDCVIYRPDDECIEAGRATYKRLLRQHLRCMEERAWPGISEKYVVSLSVDKWEIEKSSS